MIIEEVFSLDKIEFLQSNESMEIYQETFDLMKPSRASNSRLTSTLDFATFYNKSRHSEM